MRKEKETKKNHERGRHKAIQYQSVALTGTKCRRIQYLPSGTGRPTSTKRGFRPGTNSIFLAVSLVSAQLIDILKYGQFDQILPTHPLTSYGPYNSTNHALNCGQNYCANQLWARTDLHQHCCSCPHRQASLATNRGLLNLSMDGWHVNIRRLPTDAGMIWQSSPVANTRRCDGHICMG